jgi:exopolyphosphatase/guanosine-5'-triphosphate,3'-diphosphate pyrophosphatase
MTQELFGLLEMGSNSLKLYLVSMPPGATPSIRTHKFPWRIAHAFFESGALTGEACDEIVERLGEAKAHARGLELDHVLTIATGMFREIDNFDDIAARVRAETGVRVRVISGPDEAGLMARGFRDQAIATPALLCDLGGATMEWAWFGAGGESECGSEPLGAIRNEYLFAKWRARPDEYLERSVRHCDGALARLPCSPSAAVVATGGTARTLAQVQGERSIPLPDLEELVERVARDGPPPALKSHRRSVFLAGIVVLWRVVAHCGAPALQYGTSAVRHGMVVRLLQLLEKHAPSELHATQLLRSTQKKQ